MNNQILQGDSLEVLKTLPDESVDMIFTSPTPYGQGSIGIGSEDKPFTYLINLTNIFTEAYRVIKPQGGLWINMSDRHDNEDGLLNSITETFRIYMVNHNPWQLRNRFIWVRTEKFEMQEDYNRAARDWEYILFFVEDRNHYFNNPKNKVISSVIYAPYRPPRGDKFESGFPEEVVNRAIHLGCPKGGTVLDPFADSGLTGLVAEKMGRNCIMIELDEEKV